MQGFWRTWIQKESNSFPLSYYNLMLILIPFYPYMFVPPCSLDLFSILTASDATSWICIFPLLKHYFHLCTGHKNYRWNLNQWLEILTKVFFGRSRIFGWTFLTFLALTLDLVGRVTCSATSLGWLIRGCIDCGLEVHRPKWKASKNRLSKQPLQHDRWT